MPTHAIAHRMSQAIMAIRAREPFFGTLLLHTDIRYTDRVPTAATDGRYLFMNPAFADQQTTPQLMGLLVHEVLHAALLHVPRGVRRQRRRWTPQQSGQTSEPGPSHARIMAGLARIGA